MTVPFVEQPLKVSKPTSYLRPWLVDDSPVRGTKPSMVMSKLLDFPFNDQSKNN